jgi:hypothetical protein
MAASHSAQDMVRPGEPYDLYYYDGETSRKQAFPTTQNTKYVVAFNNLGAGSSVLTIPPQNGVQDVVIEFALPAVAGATGVALPRGWGYQLIKQVSFRYGGSSQYFLTGDQILQNALRRQPSRTTLDDLLTLGGNAAQDGALNAVQTANVVLTLPHNIPTGRGKEFPLPTDLLTQQVQITCEIVAPSSLYFAAAGAAGAPAAGLQLSSAQWVVQQVMLNNQSDALARRVDMATNAYAFPCEFVQQKQVIPLTSTAASQEVVLTGFRSGEVKAIHCWVSRSNIGNPNLWYLPDSIQMTYAGDIYARYENASSPLWNLINGDKAPAVDNTIITDAGGGAVTLAQFLSQWVELPFAQTFLDDDAHHMLVHGKPITNGIVNLSVTLPAALAAAPAGSLSLNVSYIYNTTLLFSQGTADYVF